MSAGAAARAHGAVVHLAVRERGWLQFLIRKILMASVAVLLTACGTDTNMALEGLGEVVPPANAGGRVISAMTGSAIAGASVMLDTASGTTDSSGDFLLSDVAVSGSAVLHVEASGYVDNYIITNTVAGLTANVLAQLLPVAQVTTLTGSTGGSAIVSGSTAQADIVGNSLEANGATVTGSVDVAVTPINMAQNLTAAPGDFTDDSGLPLESYGGLAVTATDGSGNDATLATGQTATVRIPYSTRDTGTPPPTLTLYYFDPATAHWVAGGIATLAGTAPDQYYTATIDRLGTWMAGTTVTPTVYLNGCVVREGSGTAAGNVRVVAEGISYSGTSAAISDNSGHFRMPIKSNGTVIVNGQVGPYVTNTFTAGPASSDITMTSCLSLAALSGAPRITLTWGGAPSDLDSHLFAPDGTHVSWMDLGTLAADPYIKLDVDDVTSYGPEVMTATRLMVGTYTYGVHNYSGNGTITGSPARVELRRGLDLNVFSPTVAMGETASDTWWVIFTMTVDAQCNVTVTPVNTFTTGDQDGPASPLPTPVTRQYCVPPP